MRVCLGRDYKESARKQFLEMLAAFERVYWFESYHAIAEQGQNSMNHTNMPEFYKWLDDSGHEFAILLKKSAQLWSLHMMKQFSDEKGMKSKLFKNLIADPAQMVLADSGLAMCMNIDQLAYLQYMVIDAKGFSAMAPVTNRTPSNIYMYRQIPWLEYSKYFTKMFSCLVK